MSLEAAIRIDAPAGRVWSILTDLGRYAEWNPFIIEASGTVQKGETVSAFIRPPGQRGMAFRPRLLDVVENRRVVWRGSVLVRGLLDGVHTFSISEIDTTTVEFAQSETFRECSRRSPGVSPSSAPRSKGSSR